MSDKYEQASDYIRSVGTMPRSEITAYLREQFPEPVKIDGVRELVENIREGEYICGEHVFIVDDDQAERLITDFIEKREAGKWIPVTERLPDNIDGESEYLLFYDYMKEDTFKGFYDFYYHSFVDMEHVEYKFVTHWQPLPSTPKEMPR